MDRHKCISGIFFLSGLIVTGYFIYLLFLPGSLSFGVVFIGLLGLILLIFAAGLFLKRDHTPWNGIWRIFKLGIILFACWLFSFIIMVFILIGNSKPSDIADPQYLIILGASLYGEHPGLTLEQRLQTGLSYLKQNPGIPVIVSGGQGLGEDISEAEAMSRFLRKNGIPEERIILEDASYSTSDNFRLSAKILDQRGEQHPVRIMIVTSDFHLLRSSLLAKRNGFISGRIPAPTPLNVLPVNLVREYFAVPKSFLFDR